MNSEWSIFISLKIFSQLSPIQHPAHKELIIYVCVTAKGTLGPLLQVTGLVSKFFYSVISTQQSFQVKRFNVIGCKVWPNLAHSKCYVQIKDQWCKHSYCSEWIELWYGMPVRFLWSEMTELALCEFIILFKYLLLIASNVCESDTSGSRPKVSFAVTHHIYM